MLNKNTKLDQRGAWSRSCDLLLNFGPNILSLEKLKLQNSNVVGWLRLRLLNKKIKMGQKVARSRAH